MNLSCVDGKEYTIISHQLNIQCKDMDMVHCLEQRSDFALIGKDEKKSIKKYLIRMTIETCLLSRIASKNMSHEYYL